VRPSSKWSPYLFVAPALVVFGVTVLAPILATFGLSFFDWSGYGTPRFSGVSNYLRAWHDPVYLNSYWHVAVYVAATIVLEVMVGLAMAAAVSARRGTGLYRVAFFVPVLLPMVVVAVLWSAVYNADYGLINSGLEAVGLGDWRRVWLGNPATALLAISVVSGWVFAGFYMAIFYAALQRIPKDLLESARLDGAGEWTTFRRIKLPLIRDVREVALLLCVTGGIQVFDLVFVLTNGGPYSRTEVPTTYLVKVVIRDQEVGYGSALAVILTLVVLGLGVPLARIRARHRLDLEF
jgi:raffinose/stachyose/melibiose transport system permease protein